MFKTVRTSSTSLSFHLINHFSSFQFAIVLLAVAMVLAAPEPEAKADPQLLAYTAPVVASYVPSSAVYERSYHGNFAYPYVSAPLVAASPYAAAYTAPLYYR